MEVRYIEIKTSPAGQIIRAYTPEQYKKEMARRKNATDRARKLNRLQERIGAVLAMLGFLVLLGAGGMCEIGQIIGYGLAGLFLFVFGVSSKALPLTTAPSLRRRRGWNALVSTSACPGLKCISATRIPLGSGAPTRTPTA